MCFIGFTWFWGLGENKGQNKPPYKATEQASTSPGTSHPHKAQDKGKNKASLVRTRLILSVKIIFVG